MLVKFAVETWARIPATTVGVNLLPSHYVCPIPEFARRDLPSGDHSHRILTLPWPGILEGFLDRVALVLYSLKVSEAHQLGIFNSTILC